MIIDPQLPDFVVTAVLTVNGGDHTDDEEHTMVNTLRFVPEVKYIKWSQLNSIYNSIESHQMKNITGKSIDVKWTIKDQQVKKDTRLQGRFEQIMRAFFSYVYTLLLLTALLAGCGKAPVSEPASRELTVLIGTDGYGDGSYNDTMLEGILGFCKDHPDVNLSLQQPESVADAGKRLDAWLAEEGSAERALILASNSYEDILRGKPAPKNGRVLILETDDVFPGHSSYIIRRYGASWLCGAMSRIFVGVIFKAMDGNDMIEESARGFADGHSAASDQETYTWTLANGPEGFSMRDSTYRFVHTKYQELYSTGDFFGDILFFPLLGGSLPGLFDYSRYNGFIHIAGMDVDCTAYNPGVVPYSLCVNNHLALKMYLEDWLAGKPWPEHQQFGLESEYIQVVSNQQFDFKNQNMAALYEAYYSQAVEKEKAYEKE